MLRSTVVRGAVKRLFPTPATRGAALQAAAAALRMNQRPGAPRIAEKTINLEKKVLANNYAPVPVVFRKATGVDVQGADGRKYLDFLSGYGAVNQGHRHPAIIRAARQQLGRLTLSARAFHSDNLAAYARLVTRYFGYDRVLPMNTGAEGVETALKLARKWGYVKKGIPRNKALIVCCSSNFHGRTIGIVSMSDDPDAYANYGPLLPGIIRVRYGDADALERVLKAHGPRVAGFIAEPVQGEAGVILPPEGYFKRVRALCTKHKVLFIADEVQSGLGRTGKMLAIEHEGVRPDVVVLAKALGGGVMPVAAVLADEDVMGVFAPGTHGSTFGGNPVANAVAIAALRVLHEERLPQRSAKLGKTLLAELECLKARFPRLIRRVRGRGLFCAIDFFPSACGGMAGKYFQKMLADEGLLAKTTHAHTLRMSPPLTITPRQLARAVKMTEKALKNLNQKAIQYAKGKH